MFEADSVKPRIVLFNLYHGGHNPQHLECLLREWAVRRPQAELHVVISEAAARLHPELAELTEAAERASLHRVETPPRFGAHAGIVGRELVHRRLAKHYAHLLRADRLMFMYLDAVQFSLAIDLRFPWPLSLSGIYFRPSFHYGALDSAPARGDRVKAASKQLSIRVALRNPHLQTLFSLDPFATTQLAAWAGNTECVFLPEPLWIPESAPTSSRITDGLEDGRRRLVLFGSLDKRKGLCVVLDALEGLSTTHQRKLALLLAGRLADSERRELRERIASFEQRSEVKLVLSDQHIPEEEVQALLRSCDLVLVTYVRHVGSSGVLVRAAAAGVPVLASNYGVVGAQVRRHRLGLAIDSTSASDIRDALAAWVDTPDEIPFDPTSAEKFARANTAEAFADTILSRLLPPET